MHLLLIANTLFEGVIGFMLIIMPENLFPLADDLSISFARMFGFAAMAISMLSLILYSSSERRELLLSGYTTLALFHSGLTMAQVLNFFSGFSSFPLVVIHAAFALLFVASTLNVMRKKR